MRTRSSLAAVIVAAGLALLLVPAVASAIQSVPASKFESSIESCGCHSTFTELWKGSMHAQALTDPLYLYKLAEANRASKGALGPFCDGCHGPIAAMAGETRNNPDRKYSKAGGEGVSCDFCHQVTGTGKPLGNASWNVTPDGTKRAQLTDARSPSHKTAFSKFHTTAEFCGTCHDVMHPGNGIYLEATYTEWSKSPYAAQGIVCQDCHMTPGPQVTKPNPGTACNMGPERDHVYIMTFAGGNVGLGLSDLAEARLKSAAEVGLQMPDIIAPGQTSDVTVTITNVGAGHYLPTGLTDVRQMWLEVVATDKEGAELARERHDFGTVLKDAKGRFPVEMWEAVGKQSDDRIPPKGTRVFSYKMPMPESGQVNVRATLLYRSASEEFAAKAGVELPTTNMAEVQKVAYGSDELAADAARELPGDPSAESLNRVLTVTVAVGMVLLLAVAVWGIRSSMKAS